MGGTVEIEGTADQVHTDGGHVLIEGIVRGVSGSGDITYKKGAVIGGVPTEKTTRVRAKQ
jgi:hypothetical protein